MSWRLLRPEDLCWVYTENSMPCSDCFFALVFSRLERGPEPLVLCPMIVNWLLNPTSRFETTFSTPDTFQEQILTEIYDKIRAYWRTRAEFRFFLVNFVPFWSFVLEWVTSPSRSRNNVTYCLSWNFVLVEILFQKNVPRAVPHWTASLLWYKAKFQVQTSNAQEDHLLMEFIDGVYTEEIQI